MFLPNSLTDIAPIVTAIRVWVAASQLRNTRQAVTTFEDTLANEYSEISGRFPTEALLGQILRPEVRRAQLHEFYRYFDLTNSQIFLRQIGRITKKIWKFWADGIETNLARPAFAESLVETSRRAESDFSKLRRLIAEELKADPRRW